MEVKQELAWVGRVLALAQSGHVFIFASKWRARRGVGFEARDDAAASSRRSWPCRAGMETGKTPTGSVGECRAGSPAGIRWKRDKRVLRFERSQKLIRPVLFPKAVENRPRDQFQDGVEDAILLAHGVDPFRVQTSRETPDTRRTNVVRPGTKNEPDRVRPGHPNIRLLCFDARLKAGLIGRAMGPPAKRELTGVLMRPSKRAAGEMRQVSLERDVARYAEGSCLIKFGATHVLCTASLEDKPPMWLRGLGRGWITAEYGMLPRATHTRTKREVSSGRPSGRTQEIQRLIGRSLRAVTSLPAMGERQITIDCDVLQADGGTRTAAITGSWVALHDCLKWMHGRSIIKDFPLRDHVAAVSCGITQGEAVLDLDYEEDSCAEIDANFVMTGAGLLVEVQATAEAAVFSEEQLASLLALAKGGIAALVELQKSTIR
jgi:ribonuclease PH